ncbi:MAG: serine hydrolase domain-containing protein [Pseudomonadota bacterium]
MYNFVPSHPGLKAALLGAATLAISPAIAQQSEQTSAEAADAEEASWVAEFEAGLRPALKQLGEPAIRWTLEERMAHYGVPGVSIAVLSDGEIVWARGYGEAKAGTGIPIDTDTVFSVGSLSKTGTALTALRLVNSGELDLDADVNTVLTSWQAPRSETEGEKPITLRMLLSHTAGLNVHGFADFAPSEDLPTTVQILNGESPAKSSKLKLIHEPGETYDYSGGGTTVAGLVIADKTGMSFPEAAKALVFDPLDLSRTTFEVPLPEGTTNIAYAHNRKGELAAKPRGYHSFPETAASGLWSTPSEFGTMLNALYKAYRGDIENFLTNEIAVDTLKPVQPSVHGLGPRILGTKENIRMEHSGANNSYKALYDVSLKTGNGAVLFTNGARGTALNAEIMRALSDALDWNHMPELVEIDASTEDFTPLEGRYRLQREKDALGHLPDADLPNRVDLKSGEDGLSMVIPGRFGFGRQTVAMNALAENVFISDSGRNRLEIVETESGEVLEIHLLSQEDYKVRRRINVYTKS